MSSSNANWRDLFRRVRDDKYGRRPGFYVKGSRSYLFAYEGYLGGCDQLDKMTRLLDEHGVSACRRGHDSPMNIADYETSYRFLDGELEIYSGNYMFGEPRQGAYIRGFHTLRWVLYKLGVTQPRRLKGEAAVPSGADLEGMMGRMLSFAAGRGRSR